MLKRYLYLLAIILNTQSVLLFSQETFPKYDFKSEVEANRSVTYEKAIELYKIMTLYDKRISVKEAGMTDVGRPLHEVIVDAASDFDPIKSRQKKKNILFIINGIHPGEPDGIDATLWLVQDILTQKKMNKLLDHTVIVIIPVYNISGALARNGTVRPSQNGPEMYGFRGNGQYLDLNRDFIKCDSKNALSITALFTKWDPDILIDNHVSNGADYSYVMTMLVGQPDKLGHGQQEFLRKTMLPDLYGRMEKRGFPVPPYVNVWRSTPDKGLPGFMDTPRYSSGYGALFQTFSFVPESHMLKPYDQRVKATYAFMLSMLEFQEKNYDTIKASRNEALKDVQEATNMPVQWAFDKNKADTFMFKGYDYEYIESEVSGLKRLRYRRDKSVTWKVPFWDYAFPSQSVDVPQAYVIPQAYSRIIERLDANGVKYRTLRQDTTISGSMYRIVDTKNPKEPYEGHFGHSNTLVQTVERTKYYLRGDIIVPTQQRAKRYLIETLEPQGSDSFFNWNFFDAILDRKEGFSDYVFEDVAAEMLRAKPELRKALDKAIEEDPTMKDSAYRQLNFIYLNSEYAEPWSGIYPVMRIMK